MTLYYCEKQNNQLSALSLSERLAMQIFQGLMLLQIILNLTRSASWMQINYTFELHCYNDILFLKWD